MHAIKNNITSEYIIQKSKFITKLYYVINEEEIKNILNQLSIEYKDATHICYAYIVDNIKRFQDDGEPSGTAGMPILNVIEKNNLNYILAVVIRYFGGIKLGAGGLVRAYSNSVSIAINNVHTGKIVDGFYIEMNISYDNFKFIEPLLKNTNVIKKIFNDNITMGFEVTSENYESLKPTIEKYNYTIKKNTFIL